MTDNHSGMIKLDVSARLIEPKGNLLGFASITINDSFVVDGFPIRQGKNGIFAGMPSRPDESAKGGYRETAFPITAEFRTMLNDLICGAYQLQVARIQEQAKAHGGVNPSLSDRLADGKARAAEHNAGLAALENNQEKTV